MLGPRAVACMAILACVALPSVTACSLVSEPQGPGVLRVLDWQGAVAASVEVPERGLGADCSIQVPRALGAEEVAWMQGTLLYRRALPQGEPASQDLGIPFEGLVFDADGLLGYQRQGTGNASSLRVWAIDDGGASFIAQRQGNLARFPTMYHDIAYRDVLRDLRSGDIVVDLATVPPHPTFANVALIGTDGRFLVHEAHGEGTQPTVVYDRDRDVWKRLDIPAWGWKVAVRDGTYYGVRADAAWRVDLETGVVDERAVPAGDVLDMNEAWVLTGAYAERYVEGPWGLGHRIPAWPAGAIMAVAWASARRASA